MKKYIILISVVTFFSGHKAISQTDPVLNQLLTINEINFVNKPLDSIISILPNGYISMKIYGVRNTARMLRIKYSNKVWIDLHVRHFIYMNEVDTNNLWNTSLMRKEDLFKISVYKGTNCYTGCPDY